MPSVGKLLNLPDLAVRVILCDAGICKTINNSKKCFINTKGIEHFKGRHKFNNSNIEVTLCKFNKNRNYSIRLGRCDFLPEFIWSQFKKDKITGPPRILGGYRKALKFINKVAKDYFQTNELLDILLEGLDSDNESIGISSSCSSSDNDESIKLNSSDISSDELPETKPRASSMIADLSGAVPDANEKPFCSKYCIPIDNAVTVDRLMNELIGIKKKGGREFFTYNANSKKSNHFIEVPTSASTPTTRALAKCVKSMITSGDGASVIASKVIDNLEKEFPKEFLEVAKSKGHVSHQMDATEVISMMKEGNIKTR